MKRLFHSLWFLAGNCFICWSWIIPKSDGSWSSFIRFSVLFQFFISSPNVFCVERSPACVWRQSGWIWWDLLDGLDVVAALGWSVSKSMHLWCEQKNLIIQMDPSHVQTFRPLQPNWLLQTNTCADVCADMRLRSFHQLICIQQLIKLLGRRPRDLWVWWTRSRLKASALTAFMCHHVILEVRGQRSGVSWSRVHVVLFHFSWAKVIRSSSKPLHCV